MDDRDGWRERRVAREGQGDSCWWCDMRMMMMSVLDSEFSKAILFLSEMLSKVTEI